MVLDNEVRVQARCDPKDIETYWETLLEADTLKYRLCDIIKPSMYNVRLMTGRPFIQQYYIWDNATQPRPMITGEFMLENFTGKAAQVHFSMHPGNAFRYSVETAKKFTDLVLNFWTLRRDPTKPFLKTMYGLTPVTNRVASFFNQRVGFKKIGIIPSGMKDRGKIVDGILTIKERG